MSVLAIFSISRATPRESLSRRRTRSEIAAAVMTADFGLRALAVVAEPIVPSLTAAGVQSAVMRIARASSRRCVGPVSHSLLSLVPGSCLRGRPYPGPDPAAWLEKQEPSILRAALDSQSGKSLPFALAARFRFLERYLDAVGFPCAVGLG